MAATPIKVTPIPLLKDNYAYAIVDEETLRTVIVDPSDAWPVLAHIEREGLVLDAIWCTHHHFDHVGGVEKICEQHDVREVVGSAYDLEQRRIPKQTRGVRAGDKLMLETHVAEVIDVPGHTLGAVTYVIAGNAFTGDTLFVGGCGRLFEGTFSQMRVSLNKLAALPDATRIYPGHEYAESNLAFGETIEPASLAIRSRLAEARTAQRKHEPFVGHSISRERETNVFLRSDAAEVIESAIKMGANGADADSVFEAVRRKKGHA